MTLLLATCAADHVSRHDLLRLQVRGFLRKLCPFVLFVSFVFQGFDLKLP